MLRSRSIWPGTLIRLAAVLAFGTAAPCLASEPAEQVGAVFELHHTYSSKSEGTDGSSSGANGSDTVIERVIEVTPEGLILEYDFASEPPFPHGRQDQWEFPARVFKPLEGPMRLLNGAELEARIEQWLEHTETSRSACGTWIFTWNAFQIECDPQSVVRGLERFDLGLTEVHDGVMFEHAMALAPAPLAVGADGTSFLVEMTVDPNAVRRVRAESDVVVGEIVREPVTLEDALRARAAEDISGTITVTFELEPAGSIRQKTEVTELEIRKPDGVVETSTRTETLERRLLPPVD